MDKVRKTLTAHVFRSEAKLTPGVLDALSDLEFIDAGGTPEEGYNYHSHKEDLNQEERRAIEYLSGMEFVETRVYTLEQKFPYYSKED